MFSNISTLKEYISGKMSIWEREELLESFTIPSGFLVVVVVVVVVVVIGNSDVDVLLLSSSI